MDTNLNTADIKKLYSMDIADPEEIKRTKKQAAEVTYTMIYNSGIDGGWEKSRAGEPIMRMYLLPSQNKYFTMDLTSKAKRENPQAEALNLSNLRKFVSHIPAGEPPHLKFDHMIFDRFERGTRWTENMMYIIENWNDFQKLCKSGVFCISQISGRLREFEIRNMGMWNVVTWMNHRTEAEWNVAVYMVKKMRNAGYPMKDDAIRTIEGTRGYVGYGYHDYRETGHFSLGLFEMMRTLTHLYGDKIVMSKFIDKWMDDLDMVAGFRCDDYMTDIINMKQMKKNEWDRYHGKNSALNIVNKEYNNNLEKAAKDGYIVFDAETLANYLIFKAKRQGQLNISNMLLTMKDTYEAELQLYGDVKEKYPEHLVTYHDATTYKAGITKDIRDKIDYEKIAATALQYEGSYKDYVLVALKTIDDVFDEATQQSNCVKSYVQHVIDGRCLLMGLRMKDTPAESLVTVEIVNGLPTQYLRAHNRSTTKKDDEALFNIMRKTYEKKVEEGDPEAQSKLDTIKNKLIQMQIR